MLSRLRLIKRLPKYAQHIRWNHSHTPLTPIEKLITGSIRATGPISFSTYMSFCLAHPIHGYYMNPNNPVFGTRGDFITSPEISQVFGELVAIWFLSNWTQQQPQTDIRLVELGPGRGTLTEDITRVISRLGQSRLKSVHLVESSESLRQVQNDKLAPIAERSGWELIWHDTIDDIPKSPDLYTMLVAHEFFDALPIHVFEKMDDGWKEILISHKQELLPNAESDHPTTSGPEFCRVIPSGPTRTSEYLAQTSPRFNDLSTGSKLEISPSGFRVARKIAELLQTEENSSEAGGSALIIDYGDDKAFGNSIRAFKDHKEVDVFHQPGDCDITANVDFAYLREACSDLVTTHGPTTQAEFLTQMGLPLRVAALMRGAGSQERKEVIQTAAERLINPLGMGREYKFLGLTSRKGQVWPFIPREQEPEREASPASPS